MPSSRGSSRPRSQTTSLTSPALGGGFFSTRATLEVQFLSYPITFLCLDWSDRKSSTFISWLYWPPQSIQASHCSLRNASVLSASLTLLDIAPSLFCMHQQLRPALFFSNGPWFLPASWTFYLMLLLSEMFCIHLPSIVISYSWFRLQVKYSFLKQDFPDSCPPPPPLPQQPLISTV